ncbi:hypothetical protein ASPWEDRAFT_108934 [Aspergillus wentii DTO 134E9]|uniref:Rhodopsin domain-containing protein n=1 Tax=Aspergillus wentii DTO 134E9 TaxID=1073089 RepID=A0A1L9RSK8_ASPWE|nr:uncharacterized protein ASPWEDRAFT_108934 [Aspergillus wentii DTO 134E9]OJJ37910.1 hypothetical protein ASPWEDRAFT_108934 [Aspergillus wentii DTO 134E9]
MRNVAVRTTAAIFMPIASITVFLRCYVRLRIVKGFGWDDAAMVVAMLFYFMFGGCMIGGSLYGTGYVFADLEPPNGMIAMKYWWLCEIAYCFASVFCKISVCIFLMRITIKPLHIWTLYTVMTLTVITCIVFMLIMLLQCHPLQYFWTRHAGDPSIQGYCINMQIVVAMTYVYSVFAGACDFTVGILPVFLVKSLNMHRQTKLAVIGILSMACIASSAVIVRFPFVHTFADPDFLYSTYQIAIWSNIETGLGITAGSLATLRPLLRKVLGSSGGRDYTSGLPHRSSSRMPGVSHDRPYPLGSVDRDAPRLRPDKLAVTVTTIQSQNHDTWTNISASPHSSEERLNVQHPTLPGISETGGEIGLSIHRTVEVTQTMDESSIREHV